ncbi:heat shock protein HtpX [Thermosyntropha lipolytica DSM 11003]|uniref:Heat shock protein HtpX n=1 Tax=Thermosyntropha lipolytica DSM 11003 TaxID=1123382 RepID=A0A1M5S575_9FIRM|nr:M48 family metalloprotease [Thermosyntropha lipolytica]SHH33782.1 heat shock protein HtpX [Thermosyntropha lipolytica DSM 11003]
MFLKIFRLIVFSLIVIINGFIAWMALYLTVSMFNTNLASSTVEQYTFLGAVAITVLLIWFGFSRLGENYMRAKLGLKPPIPQYLERLQPLFAEVCQRAGKNPEDYDLFISPENIYNAYAVGKRTIVVCYPMLSLPDDELKAVLAHELAHIEYKDTRVLLAANLMNTLGNISFGVIIAITIFVGSFVSSIQVDDRAGGGVLWQVLGKLWLIMIVAFLKLIAWILYKILEISFLAVGRGEEYRCDEYACRLGYGIPLASFLYRVESMEAGRKKNLWDKIKIQKKGFAETLFATHPPIRKRIERIGRILENRKN